MGESRKAVANRVHLSHIEPALWRRVQKLARRRGIPVHALVAEALQEKLEREEGSAIEQVAQAMAELAQRSVTGVLALARKLMERAAAAHVPEPSPQEDTAYCVHCRARRRVNDPELVELRSGRLALQGLCETCGGRVSKLVRRLDHG